MAINYALDELLHWNNQNAALNALAIEFKLNKLSDNLLSDAAHNRPCAYNEISSLLNKLVLISIYGCDRKFKSEEKCRLLMELSGEIKEGDFESTVMTLNVIVTIYLENLKYPRMAQFLSKKSSREVFLAVAFVISKNGLFNAVDEKCDEIVNLKKYVARNISVITSSSNYLSIDDLYNEFSNKEEFVEFLHSVFEKVDTSTGRIDSVKSNGDREIKFKKSKSEDTDANKRFNRSKIEALNFWIETALSFHNGLVERAVMLATPKGCKDFDTERLRICFDKVDSKAEFGQKESASDKGKKPDKPTAVDNEFLKQLSISQLADQLIQLQNKLRSLGKLIHRKDRERSCMFAKAAIEFKAHEAATDRTRPGTARSVWVKPSPLEYVLISDDNSFEINMALLAVISRSLVSEFSRYKFWRLASSALAAANKGKAPALETSSLGLSVGIYKKPSDIKVDILQLKSFLIKGISPTNFTNRNVSDSEDCDYQAILEFLRSINSQFTNITAQNTSKTIVHSTLFHTFIVEQLNPLEKRIEEEFKCGNAPKEAKKIQFSKNLRYALKNNPRINLDVFKKWISVGHLDDLPTIDDLNKLEIEAVRKACEQRTVLSPRNNNEINEMRALAVKGGYLSSPRRVGDNRGECIMPLSVSFFGNLSFVKNISAPDPTRASKGMAEFVNSIKKMQTRAYAKLLSERKESEALLDKVEDKLTELTKCVII